MYPISLDLRGRLVVVVGAGTVAERKVRGLLEAGARVRVVAPAVSAELRAAAKRGEIELQQRCYRAGDMDGVRLAYAATDDQAINAQVVADARAGSVFVDDASGLGDRDFATPLTHRVGPLTFAVETGGSSPSFGRRLLTEIAQHFDERYARAAETLRRARTYVKTTVPQAERGALMRSLATRDIDELATLEPQAVEREVETAYAVSRATARSGATSSIGAACDVLRSTALVAATRGSPLALWQTRHVAAVLARAGVTSTLLPVATQADRRPDRALTALGTDGVFIKELEVALRERHADYAVHSCKDLPSTLPDDMRLAAIGPRADARDAFCSERYVSLDALPPGAIVGTSSPRRRSQLLALRPDLMFETIRGNVETRLRKLREGHFDAIVLAVAGLERLGLRAAFTVALEPDVIVPAVGQGALALETRAGDAALAECLHAAFAHVSTEFAVAAERAFLRTCRGGCQAPIGAYATYIGETLSLRAVIAQPDGGRVVAGATAADAATIDACERLGIELAQRLLAQGGEGLLAEAVDVRAPGPLAGCVFVLPRTQERFSTIAPAFERAGARVIEVRDAAAAAAAFAGRPPDALLFPSSGAVRSIAAHLPAPQQNAGPIVAAMGEASAAEARAAGFPPDVIATEPTVAAFVQSVTRYILERRQI